MTLSTGEGRDFASRLDEEFDSPASLAQEWHECPGCCGEGWLTNRSGTFPCGECDGQGILFPPPIDLPDQPSEELVRRMGEAIRGGMSPARLADLILNERGRNLLQAIAVGGGHGHE